MSGIQTTKDCLVVYFYQDTCWVQWHNKMIDSNCSHGKYTKLSLKIHFFQSFFCTRNYFLCNFIILPKKNIMPSSHIFTCIISNPLNHQQLEFTLQLCPSRMQKKYKKRQAKLLEIRKKFYTFVRSYHKNET